MRLLMAAMLLSVALAGCSDGGGGDGGTPTVGPDYELKKGLGAISGLLVDDRYRPIYLAAEPTGAQVRGFILVQESGQQVQTNENGEFTVVDLEPGQYTLRVNAEGHEAVPQKATVKEGVFVDAQMVARRALSANGSIVTNEFTAFKACEATLVAYGSAIPCTLDLSGDSDRGQFDADYSEFREATYLVTEFLANQDGFYEIRLTDASENCAENYAIEEIVDGRYVKIINKLGEAREENHLTCGNKAWDNDQTFTTVMFVDGVGKGALPVVGGFGAGVYFAIEGKFIHSVFLGEPEQPIEDYCAMCGHE